MARLRGGREFGMIQMLDWANKMVSS